MKTMGRRGGSIRPALAVVPVLALGLALGPPAATAQSGFSEGEVRVRNGPVELAGTLVRPDGPGPHPAVVFLHGSGPVTRDGARPYAEAFARMGVASLFFDKRGVGESGGDWLTSSLDDLADDGLAAVEHLRSLSWVDPDRVGFWGVSQAGWVATLAAARDGEIGFMILISGGGASPRASEIYSYTTAFREAGLSQAERAEAEGVLELYFRYLATGEGRERALAAIREGKDEPWYEHAPLERIFPSEENRENWSWVASWDPAPHIRKLHMPLLLLFGEEDRAHPTPQAVARWREGLDEAGNHRATIMVFPGAGHGIRMRARHEGDGRAPFADGYAEVQLGWLWRHVVDGGGG